MEDRSGRLWGVATASGLVSFLILVFAAGYGWFAALLLALLILALVALVLWILWDEDDPEEESIHPFRPNPFRPEPTSAFDLPPAGSPDAPPPPAAAPARPETPGTAPAPPPAAPAPIRAPAGPRAGAPHKNPSAAHKSPQRGDPRTAPRRSAPPPGQPRPAAPAAKPAAVAGSPVASGLQRIRGIGPRLEARLQALGIASLADLAALDGEDVARIEAALGMPGRMAREGWQAQARALLPQGEPE